MTKRLTPVEFLDACIAHAKTMEKPAADRKGNCKYSPTKTRPPCLIGAFMDPKAARKADHAPGGLSASACQAARLLPDSLGDLDSTLLSRVQWAHDDLSMASRRWAPGVFSAALVEKLETIKANL